MGDLSDLYQEVTLDHNRRPRNFRVLDAATHQAEGFNPLCGDRLELFLTVDSGVIKDVGFQGSGCAISKASASLMTDCLKGCLVADACSLFERFHRMVTTPPDVPVEDLGKLSALAGLHGHEPPRPLRFFSLVHAPIARIAEGDRLIAP